MTEGIYSIAEVADILQTSQKVVRRHIAADEIDYIKSGSSYKITESALEKFISSKEEKKKRGVNYDLFGNVIEDDIRLRKVRGDIVNWADVSPYWDAPPASEMTFVDLFCGAGGLSKGLEMAGLEGICGLDWFDEAGQTYKRNFHHPFVNGDIKLQEKKEEFYSTVRKQLNGRHLNVVAGGFPCQGFSMSGNRIVDDARNSLYLEMLEIVRQLQPDFVLCENVKGLRSMLGGKVEQKIIEDYRKIGYAMNVTTLCAADYYTPQKRERVIFVGNRIGVKNYHPKPILTPYQYITTGSAIGDLMNHPEDEAFNHVPTKHKAFMEKRIMECPEGKSLYKGYSDAWKKCPWNEASCTIKENHGGVNLHPKLPRVLTAREMARLQSFPDDFIFEGPKNKQLVQIGNAVPCLLGKAIGLAIRYAANDLTNKTEMKTEKENWRDTDVNIDSLWIIGPRAKGGKRENNYHGNFAPQVPDHLIRRYTEEGDTVLDMFMGSGTTLFECERLKRNYIGFDINKEIIDYVWGKMDAECPISYFINDCDVCNGKAFSAAIESNLRVLGKQRYDFVISHPPYLDIIKFTNKPNDLSNISDLKKFIDKYIVSVKTAFNYLRSKHHFALVIGDLYRNGEVVPLGFYLMNAIRTNCNCKLKGIVVKDIVGNRGKAGQEALWRYRTLKSDTFLFKHEYIMVFRKD